MIARHWPAWWWARLGWDRWPDTYAAFDLETTGLRTKPGAEGQPPDRPTEFGWVLVVDGEARDRGHWLCDWLRHPGTDPGWLRGRFAARDAGAAGRGVRFGSGFETCRDRGVAPARLFGFVRDWFARLAAAGVPAVAHNGLGYDLPMLRTTLADLGLGAGGVAGADRLVDTAAIEAGNQLAAADPTDAVLVPTPGHTWAGYQSRLAAVARGRRLRANLADHCFVKYGWAAAGVDPAALHGAQADADCCRRLMAAWAADAAGFPPADRGRPGSPEAPRSLASAPGVPAEGRGIADRQICDLPPARRSVSFRRPPRLH